MTYTGKYGFVLLPDTSTAVMAQKLGADVEQNVLDLLTVHKPHMTLYHAKFQELPHAVVEDVMESLACQLPISACFTDISAYGGKFVFWNIVRDDALDQLHNQALAVSQYCDLEGEQQADSEKLSLSQEEQDNVRKFGHPLVKGLWSPHITIGYVPGGYDTPSIQHKHEGVLQRVAFVEVGEYGTIKRIVIEK